MGKYSGKQAGTRTLIAVPTMAMVHVDFMKSFVDLEKDENTNYTIIQNSLIYNARNMVAKNAIRYGFDRVMWIDSDMTFSPDTLRKLSRDMEDGLDCVSGLYFMRSMPTKPIVYKDVWYRINSNEAYCGADYYLDYPKEQLFKCAGAGFGCMMTSVVMLKKLVERYGAPFTPMMGLGEDLAFCWRANQNGFVIHCDSRIKCGHIGTVEINESMYE